MRYEQDDLVQRELPVAGELLGAERLGPARLALQLVRVGVPVLGLAGLEQTLYRRGGG